MVQLYCSVVLLGGNMTNQRIIENELSSRLGRTVRFSYDVYFSPEEVTPFRKIFVDGQEVSLKIFLNDLYKADSCGTLEEKYKKLLSEINKHLSKER